MEQKSYIRVSFGHTFLILEVATFNSFFETFVIETKASLAQPQFQKTPFWNTRKREKMETGVKALNLQPFKGEKDDLRQFDLIRGLVIFMTVRAHTNKNKNAISGQPS